MSALPRPETLVPCPALSPSPSFVPEPVALPRCDLRRGGQDETGGDLSCHLRHEPELAAGIYPSFEKKRGLCKKSRPAPVPFHRRHSRCLFTQAGGVCAPWAELPGWPRVDVAPVSAGKCPALGSPMELGRSRGALSRGAIMVFV